MSDAAIRKWKKLPIWEQTRKEIIAERADAVGELVAKKKDSYKKEIEQRQKDWEAFREGIKSNGAYSLSLANNSYKQAIKEPDALKGCKEATRSGAHFHSRNAMEIVKTLAIIDEQLYQNKVLIEYFDKVEKEEQDQDMDTLDNI